MVTHARRTLLSHKGNTLCHELGTEKKGVLVVTHDSLGHCGVVNGGGEPYKCNLTPMTRMRQGKPRARAGHHHSM